MNIRTAIFQQLNSITEIQNKVEFNRSSEIKMTPRVVYSITNNPLLQTLDGPIEDKNPIFDINLYTKDRDSLFDIGDKITSKLSSLFRQNIGGFLIKSIDLNSRDLYENTIDQHRMVFEFEIYY